MHNRPPCRQFCPEQHGFGLLELPLHHVEGSRAGRHRVHRAQEAAADLPALVPPRHRPDLHLVQVGGRDGGHVEGHGGDVEGCGVNVFNVVLSILTTMLKSMLVNLLMNMLFVILWQCRCITVL